MKFWIKNFFQNNRSIFDQLFFRKKNRITFIKQLLINVYSGVNQFPDFIVPYHCRNIKNFISCVSFGFINANNSDIVFDNPVSIEIKPGSGNRWLDYVVINQSNGFEYNIDFQGDLIGCSFNELLRGQFVLIRCLVESKDFLNTDSFFKQIEISHSGSNIGKIRKVRVDTRIQRKHSKSNLINSLIETIGPYIFGFIFIILAAVFIPRSCIKQAEIQYSFYSEGKAINGKIANVNDTDISLTDVRTGENHSIPISDFQDKDNFLPFIKIQNSSEIIITNTNNILIGLSVFILLLSIFYFPSQKRKIYKIIERSKKTRSE